MTIGGCVVYVATACAAWPTVRSRAFVPAPPEAVHWSFPTRESARASSWQWHAPGPAREKKVVPAASHASRHAEGVVGVETEAAGGSFAASPKPAIE